MYKNGIGEMENYLCKDGFTCEIEMGKNVEPVYVITKSFELWGTPPPRPLLDSVG